MAVFDQFKDKKNEISFGFSEVMLKSGYKELQKAFIQMNPAI